MADFNQLMHIKLNEFYFAELVKEVSLSRVIPFVGAGISANIYPTWSEYILCVTNTFTKNQAIVNYIKELLAVFRYEEALQYIYGLIGDRAFHDHLSFVYKREKLLELSHDDAIWMIPKIFSDTVITTNFDCSLEFVYNKSNNPFKDHLYPLHMNSLTHSLVSKSHILVKIHGDIAGHSGIVITKEQYDDVYGSSDESTSFKKFLERFMLSKTLLFLGCSINNDRTIDTLRSIVRKYDDVVNYAIIELPEDESEALERVRYLSDLSIRPIWYPKGEHDSIRVLLEKLYLQVKTKEEFLRNRENELLKELIYSGFEYICDEAEVTIDKVRGEYRIECSKTLRIIASNVDGFNTQVYANRYVGRSEIADYYYSHNWIDWDSLKIEAFVAIDRGPEEGVITEKLVIKQLQRTGNYIPFRIEFKSLIDGEPVVFRVGDIIQLNYSYTVSNKYWGSYINRSSSYFGEKLVVSLVHDGEIDYHVYEILYSENRLRELQKYEYSTQRSGNRDIINLPEKRNGRYRITWNARGYFGDVENSDLAIDTSKLVMHLL